MTSVRPASSLVVILGLLVPAGCVSTGGLLHRESKLPAGRPGAKAPASAEADDAAGGLTARQVADVQIALARSLEAGPNRERAVGAYREALKHDPDRADACGRLAVLLDCQGKTEEAAEWHARALALAPENADLLCNQGYSLYLQGRIEEAEAALRRALRQQPEHARARTNLGLVLARQGREDEALRQFRQAGLGAAEARANLAHACVLRGAWPEARSHYQAALAADASCAAARKGLTRLEEVLARRSASDPALAQDPAAAALAREQTPDQ